jgi:hypothetical protein
MTKEALVAQQSENGQTDQKAARAAKPRKARGDGQPAAKSEAGSAGDRQSGNAEAAQTAGVRQLIAENPLPMTMIWLGVGWVLIKQLSGGQSAQSDQVLSTVKGRAQAAGQSAGQAVTTTQDAVGRLLGGAQHVVAGVGEEAPRAAAQVADSAGSQVARVQSAARRLLEERPLVVTAAGLAGGAALALVAPTTRTETQALEAPTRELVTRAESLASETIDTLEQAVGSKSNPKSP